MSIDLSTLFFLGVTYLLLLFGAAYITDRGWLPERLVRHPVIFVLSLGVYASVWTFYGAIGMAYKYGYSFLTSYFGASALFMLAPMLLLPLARIARTYQLSSIADLFAFRYRSQAVGTLVTLLMLLATLPLISIQIQAVSNSIHLLNSQISADRVALLFCLIMAIFAILFGARHPSIRTKHQGLVVAMALESLIKLVALIVLALYALFVIFDGNSGLERWLTENKTPLAALRTPMESDAWRTMLLAFFTSALVMPHMFHMLFTENLNPRALSRAIWGFPLYLALIALTIPVLLWAGIKLGLPGSPEYYLLTMGTRIDAPWLTLLAFVGGLSAASGVVIVTAIALSGMLINHVVLPAAPTHGRDQLYQRLIWVKRFAIIALVVFSYLFYLALGRDHDLHYIGLIAFIAFMQFLPGVLATLFWPGGSRYGVVAGLVAGTGIWLITSLLPIITTSGPFEFSLGEQGWHLSAIYSLAANIGAFIVGSLLWPPDPEEQHAANSCALNAIHRPQGKQVAIDSVAALKTLLAARLGQTIADREVEQACTELGISNEEKRSQPLNRLRDQLEINLSALLGPMEAVTLLQENTPTLGSGYLRQDVHLLEQHLESFRSRLTGLAAELDTLRRQHRNTLQRLPIGVCSLGPQRDIQLWNTEMERLTGITQKSILGQDFSQLPRPWQTLLESFADSRHARHHDQCYEIDNQPLWLNLHKAALDESTGLSTASDDTAAARSSTEGNQVILVEDQTEIHLLRQELEHSERLASIGRLAAGVAHEIGNPVTGIACLAQNLKYETEQQTVSEYAAQILQQTQRIDRILKSMMRFSHGGSSQPQPHHSINLSVCAGEAIDLLQLDERHKHYSFHNHIDPDHRIQGDSQQILQLFINLLSNAADASPESEPIEILSRRKDNQVELSIEDHGHGVPQAIRDKLFEPFFTTKEPGQGTGLGLALVYTIVEQHFGSLQIESPIDPSHNRGTRVRLLFPEPGDN